MKNEETIIIPTDFEATLATGEGGTTGGTVGGSTGGITGGGTTGGTTGVGGSPEARGVAVKKRGSVKDFFFGDIDWKACGRALTTDVSFEGFKRIMTSDVDFGAIRTALLSPVPDKDIDLGSAIKSFCSIQVKF